MNFDSRLNLGHRTQKKPSHIFRIYVLQFAIRFVARSIDCFQLLRSQREGIPVDFDRLTALCEIRSWEWKHWPVIWDSLATNFRVIRRFFRLLKCEIFIF